MKPDYSYPPRYPNKYNYYQEIYPMVTYPMYGGSGYMPGGGSTFSGDSYAQKVPSTYYFGSGGPTPSMTPDRDRPSTKPYMGNGWSNADEILRRKQGGYGGNDGVGTYPAGKYNETRPPTSVPHIRTFFNPDDYLYNTKSEYRMLVESVAHCKWL